MAQQVTQATQAVWGKLTSVTNAITHLTKPSDELVTPESVMGGKVNVDQIFQLI